MITCPKCGLALQNGKCMNGQCDNFDRYPRIFLVPLPGALDNEGLSLEEGNDFV